MGSFWQNAGLLYHITIIFPFSIPSDKGKLKFLSTAMTAGVGVGGEGMLVKLGPSLFVDRQCIISEQFQTSS